MKAVERGLICSSFFFSTGLYISVVINARGNSLLQRIHNQRSYLCWALEYMSNPFADEMRGV